MPILWEFAPKESVHIIFLLKHSGKRDWRENFLSSFYGSAKERKSGKNTMFFSLTSVCGVSVSVLRINLRLEGVS
jgi:hypothetical protein